MKNLLISIFQLVISVCLIVAILVQQRGTGGTGIFGMGSGTAYHTKRGAEKFIHIATIILAVLFIATALLNLLLNK